MIIKEIRIKNFRSYYGDNNQFDFSEGLTVIIGDNGDGKTTFFEALQWLFDTTIDKSSVEQISEMRKSQMEVGDTDEVSVYMKFDHNGEKSVEKSFTFDKVENGGFRLSKISYRGYETNGPEREAVNGKSLIERCYDAFIQKFSMFKGEAELNVFENRTLLKDLVDKFSDIRKFDELVATAQGFEYKANKAYLKELSSDKKVSQRAKELEAMISRQSSDIAATRHEIKEKLGSVEAYEKVSLNLKKIRKPRNATRTSKSD